MKRLAAGFMLVAVLLRWVTAGTLDHASADDFGSLIGLLVATIAWAAYGWLALAVVATALERLPGAAGRAGARATTAITSEGTRMLLRSVVGVAATAPLTVAAAHAHTVHDHTSIAETATTSWDHHAGVERASAVPIGDARSEPPGEQRLPIPDRPTVGAETRYTPVRPAGTVVVRPGDSLWTIAARELGPRASQVAIDRRWPHWYAANADRIGPDPGLIRPGLHLQTPTPDQEK